MSPVLHRLDLVASVNRYVIGEDDIICDPQAGLPLANWSKQATVVNKVDIRYDFNVPGLLANDFGRHQIYTANASVTRYTAQPSVATEFRGVRTALGAQVLMDRFALLFLQRWGYPPPILLCSITFRRHLFEFLDKVYVTHSMIPDPEGGTMGLDQAVFEVLTVSPQFLDAQGRPNGRLDLALVWVGAIETSAVPISSGALSLVPGEITNDPTDVNIPLASSATVTVPGPAANRLRIGLKALNYRIWTCAWNNYVNVNQPKAPPTCDFSGTIWNTFVFNSQITYHLDYKKSTAPDAPGSGGDPSTGWVTLLGPTTRGNTDVVSSAVCQASQGQGGAPPAEDVWVHFFSPEDLVGEPAIYNVKPFFDSVTARGETCSEVGSGCSSPGCSDVYTGTTVMQAELARMTIDFIEGIV